MQRLLRDAACVRGGFASASRDLTCLVHSWDGASACAAAAPEWDVGLRREEIPVGDPENVQVLRAVQPLQPGAETWRLPPPSEGGAVFFVQCLSANNDGSAHFFDTFMMQRQIDACGLVKTARMRRCVLPVRVRMSAFWYAPSLSTGEAGSAWTRMSLCLTRMCPFLSQTFGRGLWCRLSVSVTVSGSMPSSSCSSALLGA